MAGTDSHMTSYAPITLFAYKRPWHLMQCLEALRGNDLASECCLYVFCDGPRNDHDALDVEAVRRCARRIDGFRKVEVIERRMNLGLVGNIIEGVTQVIEAHGKVIVLEDDIVTSPHFLRFMNEALDYYVDEKKVWHVSGWNFPVRSVAGQDIFFQRVMSCWGWATWSGRWRYYERDPHALLNRFSPQDIRRFNLDGAYNFWEQVLQNASGNLHTWAIFWYASIFLNNGLCLNPSSSLVRNIGHDGSGEHCSNISEYYAPMARACPLCGSVPVVESAVMIKRIRNYYRRLMFRRRVGSVMRRLRRLRLGM